MHNDVTMSTLAFSRLMRLAGVNIQHPIQAINTTKIPVTSEADTQAAAAEC